MYNLEYQIVETIKIFNKTVNQVLLFTAGVFVSVFFSVMLYQHISNFYDLIWYTFGIIVPMTPSMFGMEDW